MQQLTATKKNLLQYGEIKETFSFVREGILKRTIVKNHFSKTFSVLTKKEFDEEKFIEILREEYIASRDNENLLLEEAHLMSIINMLLLHYGLKRDKMNGIF